MVSHIFQNLNFKSHMWYKLDLRSCGWHCFWCSFFFVCCCYVLQYLSSSAEMDECDCVSSFTFLSPKWWSSAVFILSQMHPNDARSVCRIEQEVKCKYTRCIFHKSIIARSHSTEAQNETSFAQIHPDCVVLWKPSLALLSQEKVVWLDVRRLAAGITVKEHQCTCPLTLRLCKQHL